MASENKRSGGDIFIVDNSDSDWKALGYLREWTQIANRFDIATAYFEIGSLLALDGHWQQLDGVRILIGDEVTKRTSGSTCGAKRPKRNLFRLSEGA